MFEELALSFGEAYEVLGELLFFVVIMLVYSILIFKFYKSFSKRDIFKLKVKEGSIWSSASGRILYALENILISPLLILFGLGVISLLLFMLSHNYELSTVILISAAVVELIRLTAFYDEALSVDLAKLIPLTILSVFITNIGYFKIEDIFTRFSDFAVNPELIKFLIYAFILIWLTETVLTFLYAMLGKAEVVPKEVPQE